MNNIKKRNNMNTFICKAKTKIILELLAVIVYLIIQMS